MAEIDQHSRPPASPGEIEYLKNEIAVLTIQLREYYTKYYYLTCLNWKLTYYLIIFRVESSKTELLEERHKWQQVYQPVHENHLDSLLDNRLGSRDPDNKRDSGVRELNFDDPPSPTIDQVCNESIFLCLEAYILK